MVQPKQPISQGTNNWSVLAEIQLNTPQTRLADLTQIIIILLGTELQE